MRTPRRLSQRLALFTCAAFTAFWIVATIVMALTLKSEQSDLLDITLKETAELFQPILVERYDLNSSAILPLLDPEESDETPVYFLFGRDNELLLASDGARYADPPPTPVRSGYITTDTHTFYATSPDERGFVVVFGDPLLERSEAYEDSLVSFLMPMAFLVPLGYALILWISYSALRPLQSLQHDIALRNAQRLDPISSDGQPEELNAITTTVNDLMARLSRAIEGERAFATNAAHELRTPVAIALAQVQRLKSETLKKEDLSRIEKVEAALQRMTHLVERLLQMARADAGIGAASEATDIRALLNLVLEPYLNDAQSAKRLQVTTPDAPVSAYVDADAFAILATNLIENAYQHALPNSEIEVELKPNGELCVRNFAEPMTAQERERLKDRFHRGQDAGSGFGLGLHIADMIARQSKGTLSITSPLHGHFLAVYHAPT